MKIYVLTKHGLNYDCSGYFSKRKEDLEKIIEDWSNPPGWKIEEKFLSDKFEV